MPKFNFHLFVLGFLVTTITCSNGESSTCLTVYKEGGAPAVFQSPKCPRWKLSNYASRSWITTCQVAMHQGRRRYQEDRIFCSLDVRIPFPGTTGLTEVTVGIVAVFDGHNGAEASEMASKLLLDYFVLHTYFLLDAAYSVVMKKFTGTLPNKGEKEVVFQGINLDEGGRPGSDLERYTLSFPSIMDGSFRLEIFKESLLRAIHDIDTTFSKEAYGNNLGSGSTATVILIADGQILVANVGDSKALLCSEKFQSPAEAKATLLKLYREKRRNGVISPIKDFNKFESATSNGLAHFSVKELTRDHHPDRDDERSRVETSGGYVLEWGGVPRVNGELAVSRAIGDVSFKSYGVISAPEVTDWQPLTANDSYLVAASDGIFEKLSSQDVCDLLWEVHGHDSVLSELSSSCSYSLADCLVSTAFEKGTMDNMAAVVVPLRSTGFSQTLQKERCEGKGDIDCPSLGLQNFIYEQPANRITFDHMQLEYAHPVLAKFDRLLVEGKHGSFGCFYLSENLNDDADYALWAQKQDQEDDVRVLRHALPEGLNHFSGGPLNLYTDQNLCFQFGMTTDEVKEQCINPEGFASFLGLLESIPFHNTGSSYGSFKYTTPDMRYLLKKRFDRGSYGEVWLAFHWNCSQGSDASNWSKTNHDFSFNSTDQDSHNRNSQNNSSAHDCHAGPPEDNLFILKRIMVERGTAVYLSGLREKYFGEVFLNASTCLGGLLSCGISRSFPKKAESGFKDLLKTNISIVDGVENTFSPENTVLDKFRLPGVVYEEGLNHIVRYVESFESRSNEIWLVFCHEGVSLSKLIYTVEEVEDDEERREKLNHIQVLHPSKWWHWLKKTEAGHEEMRSLIWQLLMALKSCHDRNITHRDVKPENMVICFEDHDTGRCLKGSPSGEKKYTTKMRIIDFGSAMDEFTMKRLYGSVGPSRAEQTSEYTPPEAFLNSTWYRGPTSRTLKYDMWSVGVVILELILGSPNVFQIDALTHALLDRQLEGWNESLKELAYKLRSFMELCILIPGSSSKHHHVAGTKDRDGASPASWKCSEEFFSQQIKNKDPLKLGFPNVQAMRLVRQLLLWDPDDRLSVDDALRHPYFQPPQQ